MPDLLTICGTAFVSVFALLLVLAIIMRLIINIFPPSEQDSTVLAGHTVYAAIASVYKQHYPETQITKIEELK